MEGKEEPVDKKPYEKSELSKLGTVDELTKGSTENGPDVDLAGNIGLST